MGTLVLKGAKRGKPRSLSGEARIFHGAYTFGASYPAGGPIVDLEARFPGVARKIRVLAVESRGGYVFFWDTVTKKLRAFQNAAAGALAEVSAGTNLSGLGAIPLVGFSAGRKEDERS